MSSSASDGSWNVSVVDGSTTSGLRAPDGSVYVVKSSGSSNGSHHPSGAYWVTPVTSPDIYYAKDGSINVSVSPYANGTQPVTVVSGSFGPPPTPGPYLVWLFI